MLIIDPWGMAFHAVGVIGQTFDFLFTMVSSYCVVPWLSQFPQKNFVSHTWFCKICVCIVVSYSLGLFSMVW